MSALAYMVSGNYGTYKCGTIVNQNLWGTHKGIALDSDSQYPDYNLGGSGFISAGETAKLKTLSAGKTITDIIVLIDTITQEYVGAIPIEIVAAMAELQQYIEWGWGNDFPSGGMFIAYNNEWGVNGVSIYISHGIYTRHDPVTDQDINHIEIQLVEYRKIKELSGALVYRPNFNTFNILSSKEDEHGDLITQYDILGYLPSLINPTIGDYESTGHGSMTYLNNTRETVLTLNDPSECHIFIMGIGDDNSLGSTFDVNGWYDSANDATTPEGYTHTMGNWMGTGEVAPQVEPEGAEEQGGSPSYIPSEAPSGKTEDNQFEIDAINSGLVTIYNPTQEEIIEFTNFLFSGITEDASAFIKRLVSSPLEYLISLSMVHYHPNTGNTSEIKFGGLGSGVVSKMVSEQITVLDCGSIDIGGEFDGFLDYGGLTKARIYLPYCGKFELDCDLIMNSTIKLTYYIDNLSGACVAQIEIEHNRKFSNDRKIEGQRYEFSGNVFQQVPLSASDYRSAVMGILTAAGGVGAIASGNVVSGISSIASGIMSMKPTIHHSGEAGSNFGYLGSQYAYVEIERPNPSLPKNFPYREGRISNVFVDALSECHRFTQVEDGTYIVNNINCTDTERQMIKNLLESGVILP